MPLDLLKHRSLRLSRTVDARSEGPLPPAINRRIDILADNYESSNSNTYFRRLIATYHTSYFGPLPFPNISFFTICTAFYGHRGVLSIPPPWSDSLAIFQALSANLFCGQFISSVSVFMFNRWSSPRSQKLWNISRLVCFALGRYYRSSKLDVFMTQRIHCFMFLLQ